MIQGLLRTDIRDLTVFGLESSLQECGRVQSSSLSAQVMRWMYGCLSGYMCGAILFPVPRWWFEYDWMRFMCFRRQYMQRVWEPH